MSGCCGPELDTSLSLADAMRVPVAGAHRRSIRSRSGAWRSSDLGPPLHGRRQRPDWLWCAGFVTFIMKHAASSPQAGAVKGSFSCDLLATQAAGEGRAPKEGGATPGTIPPGSFFLVRRVSNTQLMPGSCGNRNRRPSRRSREYQRRRSSNGIEACAPRGYERGFVVRREPAAALGARAASGKPFGDPRPQRS